MNRKKIRPAGRGQCLFISVGCSDASNDRVLTQIGNGRKNGDGRRREQGARESRDAAERGGAQQNAAYDLRNDCGLPYFSKPDR
jgi:hypothetical protein